MKQTMNRFCATLLILALHVSAGLADTPVRPAVQVEEDIVRVEPPNNGAGPLWCYGAPLLVRSGEWIFASIMETSQDVPPLCNTRWRLWERTEKGWMVLHQDERFRNREPCPLVLLGEETLLLSANSSTQPPGTQYGPCEPNVFRFGLATRSFPPVLELPRWEGTPRFTDHSYRGIGVDGEARETLLFHIDAENGRQYVSVRSKDGEWSSHGFIEFPIRSCYPQAALKNGAGHILAIGDIVEPTGEWRTFKKEKTGRDWDYVFRRLFYAWSPDVHTQLFHAPIEIDSVDATAGHITNLDLWLDEDGRAFLLYLKQPVQNALMRDRFFPDLKLIRSLECVVVNHGQVEKRMTLMTGGESLPGPDPHYARFHAMPDGSLYVVFTATFFSPDMLDKVETRIQRIVPHISDSVTIPLHQPFRVFFTAAERGGSKPSRLLDLFGIGEDGDTLRYACVQLE
ncbi:MAG TPA: hypothetical protein PKV38_11155 [bacterium]|nr:hypothetical protein [bacterium]